MRTDTISTDVYKFEELSKESKEKAIEKLHDCNTDYYDWHDGTTEDAKQIAEILGIDITNIYFSGFYSQGDGACFEGSYEYKKGSVKAIKEYAPKDEKLHSIAEELFQLQKSHAYKISAKVVQSGHYNHSGCTDLTFYRDGESYWGNMIVDEEAFTEVLRSFMDWIYKALERQYDYLRSDEAIKETIEANEDWEFTVDGTKYI